MSLDTIVNLQISVKSKAPTQAGFGTPLILGHHTAWLSDFVREYADADEMLDDGFTVNHYLYKTVQAVKSQDPSPKTVKIGRRATALTQIVELTPTNTTEGFVYSGTIDGNAFTYTVLAGATVATICTALTALIDAFAGITAVDNITKVTVTTTAAGTVVEYSLNSGLKFFDVTVDTTTDDALAAVEDEDDDWYCLIVADSMSNATALLAAAFIETKRKICVLQVADWDTIDAGQTTDTMSDLKLSAYARTGTIYHRKSGGVEWLAAGWAAQRLTATPGSDTWAFKTVAGVSSDGPPAVVKGGLTAGQESAIEGKSGNHYTTTGGLNITFDGKVAAGEYFDVVRFIDWLYARLRERVIFVLANNPKISYTDAGVDLMRGAILNVLEQGVRNGGLSSNPAPVVTAPKVADVAPADKIARLLPDVAFTATLAGAIHKLVIKGTISV